ncbi:MAG: transcription termination/antitermination NusG family protein [Phycisphaerae bacterium]|nr:transcription termination/antitermination NusG family protein [Phycisphaerae bacterium]
MLKESDNPPITWPPDKSIKDFAGIWWVVHTKSRNEKALANDLADRNVHYFLPMTTKISRKSGRKIKSLLPLFGGYLFFCGNEDDRLAVLKTNRTAGIIEVKNQPRLINELAQIQQAIVSGASLAPHKYIEKGKLCRVTSGPLADLKGIVIESRDQTRLILQVDMLGQAASVEISTDMIEVIDED